MHLTIQLLIAGLAVGSAYALAALGLVVVYKGSGVLNFAHGAIGMIGTYVFALLQRQGTGMPVAVIGGLGASALLGAVIYLSVIRPLRHSSMLSKVVATLGIMLFLENIAIVGFGTRYITAPTPLPTGFVIVAGYEVSTGGLILLGLVVVTAGALGLYYRRSVIGLATEAVSLNEPSTMRLGYFVDGLATANWALSGVFAAAAGILLVNNTGLDQVVLTNVVITVMGAAVLGGFRSLTLTVIAAEVIGIIGSELVGRVSTPGVVDVVPFAVIVIALVFRGDVLPSRGSLDITARLPAAPLARIRPVWLAIGTVAVIVVGLNLNDYWRLQGAQAFAMGIVGMSFVLLTGFVGQISLGQWVFAGVGGLFGVSLAQDHGWPLIPVLLISAVTGFGIGLLTGLSAVRIRGIALAVVTLVAANAIQGVWFVRVYDISSVTAPTPGIFGLELHPLGQYLFDALMLALVAACLWLVRRSLLGRRLLAVRASERAAAAAGFHVTRIKLLAFGSAAGIAAIGGALYGYGVGTATGDSYTGFQSILLISLVYINGVGALTGGIGVIGAVIAPALLGQFNINQNWFGVFVGGAVIYSLVRYPDGVVVHGVLRRERRKAARASKMADLSDSGDSVGSPALPHLPIGRVDVGRGVPTSALHDSALNRTSGSPPREVLLEATDVSVFYGSVQAVAGASLSVRAGEVVGLIGPNGAGKTTLFDAISGLVKMRSGSVVLGGRNVGSAPPHVRAAHGLRRTFQAAELFDDLTVWDNVTVGASSAERAAHVISMLGLEAYSSVLASEVPAGLRRRVDLARALAAEPKLVLLDEPGAGLSADDKDELARTLDQIAAVEGISFLLVDHDVNFISMACERAYALVQGVIVADGEMSHVLQNSVVVDSYLGPAEQMQ